MVIGIPATSGTEIQSGQLNAGVALETGASYQSVGGGGKWMEDPKEEEEWADGPEVEGGLPTTGPQTDTEPDLQNFKAVA